MFSRSDLSLLIIVKQLLMFSVVSALDNEKPTDAEWFHWYLDPALVWHDVAEVHSLQLKTESPDR